MAVLLFAAVVGTVVIVQDRVRTAERVQAAEEIAAVRTRAAEETEITLYLKSIAMRPAPGLGRA